MGSASHGTIGGRGMHAFPAVVPSPRTRLSRGVAKRNGRGEGGPEKRASGVRAHQPMCDAESGFGMGMCVQCAQPTLCGGNCRVVCHLIRVLA